MVWKHIMGCSRPSHNTRCSTVTCWQASCQASSRPRPAPHPGGCAARAARCQRCWRPAPAIRHSWWPLVVLRCCARSPSAAAPPLQGTGAGLSLCSCACRFARAWDLGRLGPGSSNSLGPHFCVSAGSRAEEERGHQAHRLPKSSPRCARLCISRAASAVTRCGHCGQVLTAQLRPHFAWLRAARPISALGAPACLTFMVRNCAY